MFNCWSLTGGLCRAAGAIVLQASLSVPVQIPASTARHGLVQPLVGESPGTITDLLLFRLWPSGVRVNIVNYVYIWLKFTL